MYALIERADNGSGLFVVKLARRSYKVLARI
jgi:hypothetical protein